MKRLRSSAESNAAFRKYFSVFGIEPIRVAYEELVSERDRTISRILDELGIQYGELKIGSKLARQSNAINERFRKRFVADYAAALASADAAGSRAWSLRLMARAFQAITLRNWSRLSAKGGAVRSKETSGE